MQLKIKPTVYGRYILLNKIAVGGMAEVFRAKSFGAEGFEKLIAIKRLYPHLCEDESFVRMFINEAKLAATLNHVNIAPIYDFGRRDGLYYIGMEYVRGCDLSDLIERCRDRKQQVPLGLAVWLLIEICNGLDYAHRKHDDLGNFLNLIHRDITPQNILLSYEGEVKIADFGIAKVQILGRDETTGGVLKGKFSYMSPEQVRGERMDHRSDIFSLGIVAWELLTCQKMFDGPNDYHILEKVREALFIPPRQINPNLPPELEQILMRALTRFPQDRYPSVGELRLDLLRFLSGSHLFPSRAHLSAFVRKLFKERLDRESSEILEETGIARGLHEKEQRESRNYEPENSLFPSSSNSVAPIAAPSPLAQSEVLAGGLPNFSASSAKPSMTPSTRDRPLITRGLRSLGGFRPDFELPPDEEEDEPTLPDVSQLEQSNHRHRPAQVISRPAPGMSAQPSFLSPAPVGLPPMPGHSPQPSLAEMESALSLETSEPTIAADASKRPPRPSHIILPEHEDDEDDLFAPSFSFRKHVSLIVGLGTFVLGVLLVLLFSWLLAKKPEVPPPTRLAEPGPAKVATVSSKGRLIIESFPWAYVYIDRKFASPTPFNILLKPGTYNIQLLFPSRSGARKRLLKQFKVDIVSGKETRKRVDLSK